MKKDKVTCCDLCFDDIARRSSSAARLWLDLCLCSQQADLLAYEGYDTPQIRWLEVLGYLRSTETDKQILIKMEGYGETEEGEAFFCCWGDCHA